ncbi:Lrp/AsnC family transcriptional regulator [Nanoarchaeota archaeon]
MLDLTDKKIMRALDLNSRIPLSELARKVRMSRDKVNYRVNNLVKKGVIRKFVCMINPGKLNYSVYKLYFKFQNMDKKTEEEAINYLISNNFIYWIASCQGKWDLTLTVFAHDINHFDEILMDFTSKYGDYIMEQDFNTTLVAGILSKDWILPEQKTEKLSKVGGEKTNAKIDEKDVEILKILANNSRMNAMEIARKTKLTQRQVIYRIKDLEKKGVILGYTTSLNLEVLGKQFFKSVLHFNYMNRSLKQKLTEFYKSQPEVGFFVFCVGGWPTEVELIVDNNQQYFQVMEKLRTLFPELKGYETLIFPKEYKFDWMPLCYKVQKNV